MLTQENCCVLKKICRLCRHKKSGRICSNWSCVDDSIISGGHCVDTENLWKLLCGHSLVLIGSYYLVYTKIFVCLHRVFLCKLVSGVLFWLGKLLFS